MGDVWEATVALVRARGGAFAAVAIPGLWLPIALRMALRPLATDHGAAIGVVGLACALVTIWGYAAIQAVAIDPALGAGGAMRLAARRYPILLAIALILVAALLVLMLPAFGMVAAAGIDWRAMQGGMSGSVTPAMAGTIMLAGVWMAIVLIAAIFVQARLTLTYPIVLAEGAGVGAIARSWRMSRRMTWRIVGANVAFGLVLCIALLATTFVAGSVFQLLAGEDARITVATVLTAITVAAVEALGILYISAFFGRLYTAVRDRAEAHRAATV